MKTRLTSSCPSCSPSRSRSNAPSPAERPDRRDSQLAQSSSPPVDTKNQQRRSTAEERWTDHRFVLLTSPAKAIALAKLVQCENELVL